MTHSFCYALLGAGVKTDMRSRLAILVGLILILLCSAQNGTKCISFNGQDIDISDHEKVMVIHPVINSEGMLKLDHFDTPCKYNGRINTIFSP